MPAHLLDYVEKSPSHAPHEEGVDELQPVSVPALRHTRRLSVVRRRAPADQEGRQDFVACAEEKGDGAAATQQQVPSVESGGRGIVVGRGGRGVKVGLKHERSEERREAMSYKCGLVRASEANLPS